MGRKRDTENSHFRYQTFSKTRLGLPPGTIIEPPKFDELGFDDEAIRNALSKPIKKPLKEAKNKSTESPYDEKTTEFGVRIIRHKATRALYLEKDELKIWIFPMKREVKPEDEGIDEDGYKRCEIGYLGKVEKIKIRQFPLVVRLAWKDVVFMRNSDEDIPEEQRGLFGYPESSYCFSPEMICENWNFGGKEKFPEQFDHIVALCIKHTIPSRHVSDILGIFPKSVYNIARKHGLTFDYKGKFEAIRRHFAEGGLPFGRGRYDPRRVR